MNQVIYGQYVDSMRVTAEGAPVLALQLQAAAPADASAEEKRRLREVVVEGDGVAGVVGARERAAPAAVRPLMLACAGAWTGAYEIVGGKARLDPSVSEDGARARELTRLYFKDGVPVTMRDAREMFGVSRRLLIRVDTEKQAKALEVTIGADMLALLRSTTDALGEAIGAGDKQRAHVPSSTALQEALVRFGRKVGAYGRILAAAVDEDDPASVERFLHALAPIDAYRASSRGGGEGGDEPTTPNDGTPSTPVTPAAA